jgi:hypothetical protein
LRSRAGNAEDLDAQGSRAWAVELRHQDALPLPEHDFAAADLQRQAVTEQQRAEMRVGVHAVAVGVLRIVVHVFRVARDHLLEEPLDVGEQGDLELVDQQRAGGVHRPDADQPFADVEPPDELHDLVRQIDQLDALIGLDDERLAMNRHAANRRSGHTVDRLLADGDSRTLAHAVPFSFGSVRPGPTYGHERSMLRKNNRLRQPCYSTRSGPAAPDIA